MLNATISADVVASSSLSPVETGLLTARISEIFASLEEYRTKSGGERILWRLVMGDTVECFVPTPGDALRVGLILKSGVKSFRLDKRIKYDREREKLRGLFEMYGVRVAIGIGEMDRGLIEGNIFKGSAINLSGRLIGEQKTSNRERVTVKNTLFIDSVDADHSYVFRPVLSLLDALFNKMTLRQSEIVYMKLLGHSECEIAQEFLVTQSSVNQHSTGAGWNSVEEALDLFSTFDFNTTFVPRLTTTLR